MENKPLHDDQLFRAVHDRLSDYEAPYNGADWDAMSRSLDQLPKASRFQWRISLNTILVAIGVAGISVIGYALANRAGKPEAVEVVKQPAVSTEASPKMQNTAMNNSEPVQPSTDPAFSASAQTQPAPQAIVSESAFASQHTVNPERKGQKKQQQPNGLFFGDQIDLRKGFINPTKEDPAVTQKFNGDAIPDTYYDLDEQGKVVPIKIDSSKLKDKITGGPLPVDSTTTKTGAPTGDSERTGFDL